MCVYLEKFSVASVVALVLKPCIQLAAINEEVPLIDVECDVVVVGELVMPEPEALHERAESGRASTSEEEIRAPMIARNFI